MPAWPSKTGPASANLAETQSFMDDKKRILVFSDAGGTGRSYHADLGARNQRKRVHYLLEPGWKADTAIQGLGRSNRTNQAQPPLFRPVSTNVKGEKRFLSTIARRLDSLGAITRGQRQTGGQGLFRPEDNLESAYAQAALIELYGRIFRGEVEFASLKDFEEATGLSLTAQGGAMREDLPPITTFLNRLLALRIALQNRYFELFEELLNIRVEAAIAAGIYDQGLETIRAESLVITARDMLHKHARTGAETSLLTDPARGQERALEPSRRTGAGKGAQYFPSCKPAIRKGGAVGARLEPHPRRWPRRGAHPPHPPDVARHHAQREARAKPMAAGGRPRV